MRQVLADVTKVRTALNEDGSADVATEAQAMLDRALEDFDNRTGDVKGSVLTTVLPGDIVVSIKIIQARKSLFNVVGRLMDAGEGEAAKAAIEASISSGAAKLEAEMAAIPGMARLVKTLEAKDDGLSGEEGNQQPGAAVG